MTVDPRLKSVEGIWREKHFVVLIPAVYSLGFLANLRRKRGLAQIFFESQISFALAG